MYVLYKIDCNLTLVANFYPFEFHHMVTFAAKDQKDKKLKK